MVTGVAEERLGQVSHAAAVERNWFQHYLGDRPREEITGNVRGDAPSLRWIYVPIIRENGPARGARASIHDFAGSP
jgi:hypothetical protein